MRDFSINLPSWAYIEGYRLKGGGGTYDELYLWKDGKIIRKWYWMERIPNIVELEELIKEVEDEDISNWRGGVYRV